MYLSYKQKVALPDGWYWVNTNYMGFTTQEFVLEKRGCLMFDEYGQEMFTVEIYNFKKKLVVFDLQVNKE